MLTSILFIHWCCWIFYKIRGLVPKSFLSLLLVVFSFSHSHSPHGAATPVLPLSLLLSLSHCRQHCPLLPYPLHRCVLIVPPPHCPLHCCVPAALPTTLPLSRCIISLASFTLFLCLSLVDSIFLSIARCTLFFYYSFDFDFIDNLYVLLKHIYMFMKLFNLSLLGSWLS